jgi:hypothetical protein
MSLDDDFCDVTDALKRNKTFNNEIAKYHSQAFENIVKYIDELELIIERYREKYCPCCGHEKKAESPFMLKGEFDKWLHEKKDIDTRDEKWKCTDCLWQGTKKECLPVMYRSTDWRQCPSCESIAIPLSGE